MLTKAEPKLTKTGEGMEQAREPPGITRPVRRVKKTHCVHGQTLRFAVNIFHRNTALYTWADLTEGVLSTYFPAERAEPKNVPDVW